MEIRTCRRLACGLALAAATGGTIPSVAAAEVTEWDEAELFFELNDTDGDLGIHASIDGGPWKRLVIRDSIQREIYKTRVRKSLRVQGMTQMEWESAEPRFADLAPARFFRRFPEGTYLVQGLLLDGGALESEVEISHVMAEPVPNLRVNGQAAAANCSAPNLPQVSLPVSVEWDAVTRSHPAIGTPNVPVTLSRYQFFVERDEVKISVDLDADATGFDILDAFLSDPGVWKYEVIARTEAGNNTAVETCFDLVD